MSGVAIRIDVSGLVPLSKKLDLTNRQLEIVKQRTVLYAARVVKDAEVEEMKRCFNAPTNFTLNAFRVTFDKKNITATVEIKDGYWTRSQNYLETQRYGGKRRFKAFENALSRKGVLPSGWLAVPGEGADIDSFGNMKVGQIRQILSWFDAAEMVLGSTQNMGQKGRDKRRKGTKKSRGFEYFSAQPGFRTGRGSWKNGQTQRLQPGIYRRTYFGFGSAIKPVLIFVKGAGYKSVFQFEEVAQRTIDTKVRSYMEQAIQREASKIWN